MKDSMNMINYTFAKKHQVFVESNDGGIKIFCIDPDPIILLELNRVLSTPYSIVQMDENSFLEKMHKHYEDKEVKTHHLMQNLEESAELNSLLEDFQEIEDLLESQEEAPVIRLINGLLSEAIKRSSSDIHFEVFRNEFGIRFRIDGVLHEIFKPAKNLSSLIVSRIKVMSKLDIAEKKLPQDGRMSLKIAGRTIDVRVSVLPSNHGERVVLRILDRNNAKLDLNELIPRIEIQQKICKLIEHSHGILLVTGPTGSGKTTTLYAAINYLNSIEKNIITIEDPIEYDISGIGQTQVNPKVGLTFAKGLRAILRQDPDVIMVGEIRDKETANIAIEASLTGHLVLSTLHTNSALGAITRLMDMGVEPFLLSSSLLGGIAQRLVRRLCDICKQSFKPTLREQDMSLLFTKDITLYRAIGCKECNYVGYKGRIGIYEIIEMDESLKVMIHERRSEQEMKNYLNKKTDALMTDGFKRVIAGQTSIEEVFRVSN